MNNYDFDLFVIGAGSGGVRAARMSASFGAKVAIAEDRYLGGTCVNVGCVPKKLFVYSSHYSEDFQDAQGFGWNKPEVNFDWNILRDNKNKEIQRLNGVYRELLENSGCTLIDGRARFVDAHTVEVDGKKYTAKNILIAVGGWPFVPDFPGKEHVITSNEVFYMESFPKRVMVVGGGYIAVEFAGIFEGLKVDTSLVYRGEKILRNFDKEVGTFVAEEIKKKGVKLKTNTNILSVSKNDDGSLTAKLSNDSELTIDCILYATGRKPQLTDLGLENINLALNDRGYIQVNDHYQSNHPNIYALGDVIGRVELTPVALAEGMSLAKRLFNNEDINVDYNNIATAVFCQPNIGTVGLTEEQALDCYGELEIYKSSFKAMKHTMSGRDEKSFMKMIVDKASNKVVGVHMVGPDAGEIIQGIAIAIKAGATKADFDATIGIHPTAAEEFVTMRVPAA